MEKSPKMTIPDALSYFRIDGTCLQCREITTGHIHRTYLGEWSDGNRYIHQLFNDHVFTNIQDVSHNIELVLAHLNSKGKQTLEMIPADDGSFIVQDDDEFWWRSFRYFDDTESFSICSDKEIAYEAAKAFGEFQADLRDMPSGSLVDPIPHFMDCRRRLLSLLETSKKGETARIPLVSKEISFAVAREKQFDLLGDDFASSDHQKKPTHGDMKLNNLLFSTKTQKPVCVIDLDTCMEGSYLFDFGDMVRIACSAAKEDEANLSKIDFREDLFEGIVSGYADTMGAHLTPFEKSRLVDAGALLALTVGVRFLTDYMSGDTYFRVEYPEHNLVRARAQFALVTKIEEKSALLREIVKKYMPLP